jgi:anti-anti-sigma factor
MSSYQVVQESAQARIILGGDLILSSVSEARQAIKQLMQDGVTDLVVDLANVRILDSSGIGYLVSVFNSFAKINGKLAVVNASTDVFDLLLSMRLDRHFPISRSAG